ncbi:type IV pilus modification PilV family protein [Tautonia plasticadhaerens]|uniref:Uncharacterized protein n=1 Tax=Tautonia plasticadhaerens TaxID=2527974 RepID=A0A518H4X9_9BACT|nr:hypothetical protein [Tautonia plasticadhaerens]QDV35900.1 hypothetical protein ElP_38080 [Tautonia plasticadhaerens]
MQNRRNAARSGITLTEILISIMIMGIGFVSIAALFPISILRMRDATRDSRSTLLAESAVSEANARNLLDLRLFVEPTNSWYGARYGYGGAGPLSAANTPNNSWPVSRSAYLPTPFNKDFNVADEANTPGVYVDAFQRGLPVAYDPLFWSAVHYDTASDTPPQTPGTIEARFGSGISQIQGAQPASHGLQRITNFLPYDASPFGWPLTYSLPTSAGIAETSEQAGNALASLDDVVFDEAGADVGVDVSGNVSANSPLVPTNFAGPFSETGLYESQRTWEFTWMLTARQASAGDASAYEADIVIFHKRPIGFGSVAAPYDGAGDRDPSRRASVPLDERVVEAVWGHTGSPSAIDANGYSQGDDRTVLLRWDVATPDPRVRVGGWIADVTYERYQARSVANYPFVPGGGGTRYPGQRCNWYRVVRVGEPEIDQAYPNHRRMIIRIDSPVKAKTRLTVAGGQVVPVIHEAALINPYVVNVHSTLLYSR